MELQDYEITELIPQRPPMVMIDRLLGCNSKTATGQLAVNNSNIFLQNGYLQEAGIVEFMAQTAAALTGYKNKMSKEPAAQGYIGAIKNLVIHDLPRVNSIIRAEIVVENEIIGYTIISGTVKSNETTIAGCEMRILVG